MKFRLCRPGQWGAGKDHTFEVCLNSKVCTVDDLGLADWVKPPHPPTHVAWFDQLDLLGSTWWSQDQVCLGGRWGEGVYCSGFECIRSVLTSIEPTACPLLDVPRSVWKPSCTISGVQSIWLWVGPLGTSRVGQVSASVTQEQWPGGLGKPNLLCLQPMGKGRE